MDCRLTSLRFAALSSHLNLKEEATMGGRPLYPDAPAGLKLLHTVMKKTQTSCTALPNKPAKPNLALCPYLMRT